MAIGIMAKYDVDAVVTDVDMPGGLSGFDLVDMIAGLPTSRGIVVTSGRPIGIEHILPAKAVFIPKPYDLVSVFAVLKELLPMRHNASDVRIVRR